MRTKLVTTVLGLVFAGVLVIACQPLLDLDDHRPGVNAVSAEDSQEGHSTVPRWTGSTDVVAGSTGQPPGTSTTEPVASTVSPSTSPPPTSRPPTSPPPTSPGGDIEHEWSGSGPRVVILGDSLTVQARPHIRELANSTFSLKVGALYGEGISGGALSVNLPSAIMPAVVDEYAQDPPDVLVLALGTNDVWQRSLGLASFEREWHATTRRFPDACIVGVTVTETDQAWLYDFEEARQINRVIRRTVDVVVDWNSEASSDRYTASDHIHLTPDGQVHFAELLVTGIESCTTEG